ncbi:MAG: thermonuclease family protein [Thermomicrobiales bacterium]
MKWTGGACKRLTVVVIATLALGWTVAPAAARQGATNPEGIPARAESAEVRGHVDGATIEVRVDGETEEVVLIGLDVPARGRGGDFGECFADESFNRLRDLLPEGETVFLEAGALDRDDDDRLLRYVWLGPDGDREATLLNTKLLREGYAGFVTDRENDKYNERMDEHEQTARGAGRGLWGVCGGVHEEFVPTPTPTPSVEEVKAQYAPLVDVRELAIRPGGMIGQKIFFYGTVQTIEVARPGYVFTLGDTEPGAYAAAMQVEVAAPDGTSEWVFVGYDGDTAGMFEGSYVLVYATVVDTQSGTNLFGGSISQPLVSAQLVELQ